MDETQNERSLSPTLASKRKIDAHDPSISPPPMKRQVQSAVTKSSVASFFTPASQRPKSLVKWEQRAPTPGEPTSLLVARFSPETSPNRLSKIKGIAAFDLDSTLILTASGKKHADSARDWKWFHQKVPQTLKQLHEEGFAVAIFSNQGGLKLHADTSAKKTKAPSRDRVAEFKQKVNQILAELALPVSVYGATGKDRFRKPRTGMWEELCSDLGLGKSDVDLEQSFFVGDAGGRTPYTKNGKIIPKDFSCSDRNMAANIGIAFHTPEEYFHGESPLPYERGFRLEDHPFSLSPTSPDHVFSKGEGKEVVVFCGPPGAGKSTFFRDHLDSHGIRRINQDTLKTKDKCIKTATQYLTEGHSVAIDNTNPDPAARAVWIDLAKKNDAIVRCVWFKSSPELCEHNDMVRSSNKPLNPDNRTLLPKIAFNTFFSRFKEPKTAEGFKEVTEVKFKFRGTEEEYKLWAQYWV